MGLLASQHPYGNGGQLLRLIVMMEYLSGTALCRTASSKIIVLSVPKMPENFTLFAAKLSPMLLSYLRHYVGNASLAEDLLQETLIRMEKGFPGFEARSSLNTWAFEIASRGSSRSLPQTRKQS